MSRLVSVLVLVRGGAADTFSRTLRAGGAVRDAEYCYTTAGASSMDRCALALRARHACLRCTHAGLSICTTLEASTQCARRARCAGCRGASRR
jgi:hypothetical protein